MKHDVYENGGKTSGAVVQLLSKLNEKLESKTKFSSDYKSSLNLPKVSYILENCADGLV